MAIWPELSAGATAAPWVGLAVRAVERLRSQPATSTPGGSPWFVLPLEPQAAESARSSQWVVAQSLALGLDDATGGSFAAFLLRGQRADIAVMTERLSAGWAQVEARELHARLDAEAVRARRCALVVELAGAVSMHGALRSFATSMCDHTAATLGCDRVSLGLGTGWRHDGQSVRLLAMSHTERIVRGAQAIQQIELAMEECADQDAEISTTDGSSASARWIDRAARELGAQAGRSVLSLPLRTRTTDEDAPL